MNSRHVTIVRCRTEGARGTVALATALLLALGSAARGQEEKRPAPAGYDLFQTEPKETVFRFTKEFVIPEGFFDYNSRPFQGEVHFKGVPVGTFKGKQTGNADTIVARLGTAEFRTPWPSRSKVAIELVALSLASTQPIKVQVGNQTQLWDVKAELSAKQRSAGTITITKKNDQGGTFDSELTVYPLLRFVRRADNAERRLDFGERTGSATKLTLRGRNESWVHQCPSQVQRVQGFNDDFCAAASKVGPEVAICPDFAGFSSHALTASRP